jgi:hypothetical protein
MDKSTTRLSAKRRRIQLPLVVESRLLLVCSFRHSEQSYDATEAGRVCQ